MIKKSHFRRSLVQFRTHPLRTALALLVLGSELAARAYPTGALGKRIRLGYAWFEVVGVLGAKKSGGDLPIDPELYNRSVLVPYTPRSKRSPSPTPTRSST